MVEFLHFRRWKKRNRSNFYWVMLLMYTIWEYCTNSALDIVWNMIMKLENMIWKLIYFLSKIYIKKILKTIKQIKTWYSSSGNFSSLIFLNCNSFSCLIFWVKMSCYPQAQKYPRGQNVLILPNCILLLL